MRLIRVLTKNESRYRMGKQWMERGENTFLQVDKQLLKYGLKANSYTTRFYSTSFFMLFGFLAGFIYNQHKHLVHDNVLMAIKSNTQIEGVLPQHHTRFYEFIHSFKLSFQYLDMGTRGLLNDTFPVEYEALIRMKQYQNFKKNRNAKMDFLNIGEVAQYPFPNIQQELQKRTGSKE